jgi:hypothetical protein
MSDERGNHDNNGAGAGPEALRRALVDAESRMASAMEHLVAGKAFSQLLGQAAENAVTLTRINADVWDMVLRNFRMAGRGDIHQLGRRMNRIDDKLEAILQQLEELSESRAAGPRSGDHWHQGQL